MSHYHVDFYKSFLWHVSQLLVETCSFFSGDTSLEVFKNYSWEHYYWKNDVYFLFLLTSETYNKAAATTQKEQTQVYYDLKIFV